MDARSEQGTGKLRAAIEYEDHDGACSYGTLDRYASI